MLRRPWVVLPVLGVLGGHAGKQPGLGTWSVACFLLHLSPVAAVQIHSEPASPRDAVLSAARAPDRQIAAPAGAHSHLQSKWLLTGDFGDGPLWLSLPSPNSVFLITCRLWLPGSDVRLEFSSTDRARDVSAELYRQAIRLGRSQIVAASVGLTLEAVHLVSLPSHPEAITVLFDLGREVVCSELPFDYSPNQVITAAQEAASSSDIQILKGLAHRLRHGDVIRVIVNSEQRTLDVSAFTLPPHVASASRWLRESRVVSFLHSVEGVLSFEVPRSYALDITVLSTLLQSVIPGRHVFVEIPGADALPHAAFCVARPGQDCVTYRLTDASDPSAAGLFLAFAGVFESFPVFLDSLLYSNRPAAVLLRRLQPFGLSVLSWECTVIPGRGDWGPLPDRCPALSFAGQFYPPGAPLPDFPSGAVIQIIIVVALLWNRPSGLTGVVINLLLVTVPVSTMPPFPGFIYCPVNSLSIRHDCGLSSQSTCAAASAPNVDLLDIGGTSGSHKLALPSSVSWFLESSDEEGPPPVQAENMSDASGAPVPFTTPAGPPPPEPVNAPFQPRLRYLRAARPLEDYALGLWPSTLDREPAADEDVIRRVQADLLGLQRGLRTFAAAIPLGTPFCIHNPFTARQQCDIVEYSAGPELNPFVLFQGHARSRGWAGIVLLMPQPDATAVHLIGCPQAPGNVAVGVVIDGRLIPCCLPACVACAALRALHLDGQAYDLRPPEVHEETAVVQFRNGDCLAAGRRPSRQLPSQQDVQAAAAETLGRGTDAATSAPGTTSAAVRAAWLWVGLVVTSARSPGVAPAMLALCLWHAEVLGMHRPGGFPWGIDPVNRRFSGITSEDPVEVVLHSPFLGVFPPFTASQDTCHTQAWAQFRNDDPGWAADYFPVWPGPAFNELSVVPVGHDPALVTIMLVWGGHHRATLTPRTMTVAWLTSFVARHINSEVGGLSLPHGLAVCEYFDIPPAAFRFRNGDVVYIHDPPADPDEPLEFVEPWHLQDGLAAHHAPWAVGFQLMFPISVHLLRPEKPPLLTSIPAGESWCPEAFSFSGDFRHQFPGFWTPVQWTSARALQLMAVNEVAAKVNVVAATPEGRLCRSVDRVVSRASLAAQLKFCPATVQVGGVPPYALEQACELRNGDVVFGEFARGGCATASCRLGLWLGTALAFSQLPVARQFLLVLAVGLFYGSHPASFGASALLFMSPAAAMIPQAPATSVATPDIPAATVNRVTLTLANPFAPWQRVEVDPSNAFEEIIADAHHTLTSWHRGFVESGLVTDGSHVLVPRPGGRLTCILVTGLGQLLCVVVPSFLTPRDLTQALQLRFGRRVSVHLSPGLAASTRDTRPVLALRSGDLIAVRLFQSDPSAGPRETPVFLTWGAAHAASAWHSDFIVAHASCVLLWSPSRPARVALLRHQARWNAAEATVCQHEDALGVYRLLRKPVSAMAIGGFTPLQLDCLAVGCRLGGVAPVVRRGGSLIVLTVSCVLPAAFQVQGPWSLFEAVGSRHCGAWATRFFPVRGAFPFAQVTLAPVAPFGMASVVFHTLSGTAVALASVDASLEDIQRLAARLIPCTRFWVVIPPPSIRAANMHTHIRLRNGDAFGFLPDSSQPGSTRFPALHYPSLDRARQVASWSLSFRFDTGGPVTLWTTSNRFGQLVYVRDNAYWDPLGPTFRSLGGETLTGSWVPVLTGDLSDLHLMSRTSISEAHVLFLLPPEQTPVGVFLAGCNTHRIPLGWQLLPAIRYGDVLVIAPTADLVWDPFSSLDDVQPQSAQHTWHQSLTSASPGPTALLGFLAVSVGRAPWWLGLALGVVLGSGMVPSYELPDPPIRVGLYPWRARPGEGDLLDLSVRPELDIVLLSPFTGPREAGRLYTSAAITELHTLTQACEPAWGADAVPVWPTAALPALLVVPRPPDPSLVCLAVSSLDRHFSVLIPCSSTLSWLGEALRFLQPLQALSLRAPSSLAASTPPDGVIRWRSGDLVVALPPAAFEPTYQPPCFHTDAQVRHCAVWAVDFSVSARTNFILWRPGVRATRGHAPEGAQWRALDFTFAGEFCQHYPGRWVPVPWIAQDHAHLVVVSEDPTYVNVVIEADGKCWCAPVTAVTDAWQLWTDVPSIPTQPRVLGLSHQELRQGTVLRNGDVVSGAPKVAPLSGGVWVLLAFFLSARFLPTFPSSLVLLAGLVFGWHHEAVGARHLSITVGLAAAGQCHVRAARMHDTPYPVGECHRLWEPSGSVSGPFFGPVDRPPEELRHAAVAWSDFTQVLPPQDPRIVDWVPVPSDPLFVVVLLQCPPATRAAILPATCHAADLIRACRRSVPDLACVLASPEIWCGTATSFTPTLFLRSGDVLTLACAGWVPRLRSPSGRYWDTFYQARKFAFWGSPFQIRMPGLLFAWSAGDPVPLTVHTVQNEVWDPEHCTFRPSLARYSVDRWIPAARCDLLGLHLVPESLNPHRAHVLPMQPPLRLLEVSRYSTRGLIRDGDSGSLGSSAPSPRLLLCLVGLLLARNALPLWPSGGALLFAGASFGAFPFSGTLVLPAVSPVAMPVSAQNLRVVSPRWPPIAPSRGSFTVVGGPRRGGALPFWLAAPEPAARPVAQTAPVPPAWSASLLDCYGRAWGAPADDRDFDGSPATPATHCLDLQDAGYHYAGLAAHYLFKPLLTDLPSSLASLLHQGWCRFPRWPGGVPDEVFIATDGSGLGKGGWALAVWVSWKGNWYRLGWDAGSLASTPWLPSFPATHLDLRSYLGELSALVSAAAWFTVWWDNMQLLTGNAPARITLAVDNSAALQVAGGHASATTPHARVCRALWQSIQSRCSTHFRHVPGHTGNLVNEIADALAGYGTAHDRCASVGWCRLPTTFGDSLLECAPLMWLLPQARLQEGRLCWRSPGWVDCPRTSIQEPPQIQPQVRQDDEQVKPLRTTVTLVQANIQTIKDVDVSFFNRDGHGQRRIYLAKQLRALGVHIAFLQECRSRPGRWSSHGFLSFRSGAEKGLFGVEIWIRPDLLHPALSLDDFRIRFASPKILLVQCQRAELPVTLVAAHAPHAERPDAEIRRFWHDLKTQLLPACNRGTVLLGIDANADFTGRDEEETLVGDLLNLRPARLGDDLLLACAHDTALAAPGTWSEVCTGPTWTWQHTGGKTQRLDHLLITHGTRVSQYRQFPEFDILNGEVKCIRAAPTRLTLVPLSLKLSGTLFTSPHLVVVRREFSNFVLPTPMRSAAFLPGPLFKNGNLICLKLLPAFLKLFVMHGPRLGGFAPSITGNSVWLPFGHGAHAQARLDKQAYFESMLLGAVDHWHATGRPLEAVAKLSWASKGKAPGPDHIRNEAEPLHFKASTVGALHKKGPAHIPANFRSIAMLNGVAKLWHSQLRATLGQEVIAHYFPTQLGGRRGVDTGLALTVFRSAVDLASVHGRSWAALFVDIQAAYYEADRTLLFHGRDLEPALAGLQLPRHVHGLIQDGVLAGLGVPADQIALLRDCVECSYWRLVGQHQAIMAGRGSRPGDGLADVLFGALFAVILQCLHFALKAEDIVHAASSDALGRPDASLQIAWADDLCLLVDFIRATWAVSKLRRLCTIVLQVFEAFRFRVNLGAGKTEALVHLQGAGANVARKDLLTPEPLLALSDGRGIRVVPEYKYLGVVQRCRDTGRRDVEAAAARGNSIWTQASGLVHSEKLPWMLKSVWLQGRTLPAAYSSLATTLARSERAWGPLNGFYDKCLRQLVGSWDAGHHVASVQLRACTGVLDVECATVIARVRLLCRIASGRSPEVFELFQASWDRGGEWSSLLADAVRRVWPACGLPALQTGEPTLLCVRRHTKEILSACRRISRSGTMLLALHRAWRSHGGPPPKRVIGLASPHICPECGVTLPSAHALAAHAHRLHGRVALCTQYTLGTICLWCMVEFHNAARLRYHLLHSPDCEHGLRCCVGPVYEYGTGTKRRGKQGHARAPVFRVAGPCNATAAQRRAAEEGRCCTDEELAAELRTIAPGPSFSEGTRSSPVVPFRRVGGYSTLPPGEEASTIPCPEVLHSPHAPVASSTGALDFGSPTTSVRLSSDDTAAASARYQTHPTERFCTVYCFDEAPGASSFCAPSCRWCAVPPAIWCLPPSWARCWKLFLALESLHPWAAETWRLSAFLRQEERPSPSATLGCLTCFEQIAAQRILFLRRLLTCLHLLRQIKAGAALWCAVPLPGAFWELLRRVVPHAVGTSAVAVLGFGTVVSLPAVAPRALSSLASGWLSLASPRRLAMPHQLPL
ncbi:unnamed protein product [Symbiodinium sp. CCMP2592]|nr:unnamed protein product [Symbiodinium sp. CCMP2592]